MKNKQTIGLFSLTGCEGCYFAILDLPKQFLELKEKLEIKQFRLFEDGMKLSGEKFDVSFVEGSPITKKNCAKLREIRQNSKIIIALGACAHIGGIYHMKKYGDKKKSFSHVYNQTKGIENFDVKPIEKYIKVDFTIPGCPVSGKEFLKHVYQIIIGKQPDITQNPVCYECHTQGYECVLQKGEICLGSITLGGCEAICLKSKQGCWGCRGLVEDAEVENLIKELRTNHSEKEIKKIFEVFGIKELIS